MHIYTHIHTYIHTYIYIYIKRWELEIVVTGNQQNKRVHKKLIADTPLNMVFTESCKGLQLNPYGFYLVILPLGIR